jgi:hypothetical protein
MAEHVNAPRSFVQKHEKEIEELKQLFINYVKVVYPQSQTTDKSNQQAAHSGNEEMPDHPSAGWCGYPSLTHLDLGTLSKKQLVKVMRCYFKKHYSA